MPKGQPITSPWVFETVDNDEHPIRIQIDFDNDTRAILGGSFFRDPDCVYTKIYLGLGPDGTPNTSPMQWDVPVGSSGLDAPALASVGLDVIEDVLAVQVTAGV
jgi:hypothetical protein